MFISSARLFTFIQIRQVFAAFGILAQERGQRCLKQHLPTLTKRLTMAHYPNLSQAAAFFKL